MALAMPEIVEEVETFTQPDTPWQVVVSNDPVNLVSFVAMVFQKVLELDAETAMKYTMQVHNEGRAAVFSGKEEECRDKASALMSYNLWTHVEKSGV